MIIEISIVIIILIILILISYFVYLYVKSKEDDLEIDSSIYYIPSSPINPIIITPPPKTTPIPIITQLPINTQPPRTIQVPIITQPPMLTSSDKLNIPIVTELKFNGKVIPKPSCPFGQVYNDLARKCLCPIDTYALVNEKCIEVKCFDGYTTNSSGVNKKGNYIECINKSGMKKIISVEFLDPINS
jgi:hypothetical protein